LFIRSHLDLSTNIADAPGRRRQSGGGQTPDYE
jgi:hypothetical protein